MRHVSSCWYVFFFFLFIYYTNFFRFPLHVGAAVQQQQHQQGSRRDTSRAAGLFFQTNYTTVPFIYFFMRSYTFFCTHTLFVSYLQLNFPTLFFTFLHFSCFLFGNKLLYAFFCFCTLFVSYSQVSSSIVKHRKVSLSNLDYPNVMQSIKKVEKD